MKDIVTIDDFSKIDLRIGQITKCEIKEDSDKLLRLTVDFGDEGTRIILSAIREFFEPAELEGKLFVFILNLAPRMMRGEESQGMILCADGERPVPLIPSEETAIGANIT